MARQVIEDDLQTETGYVATQFPGDSVVKAFNSIYFKVLDEQAFQSGDDRIAVQVSSDDLGRCRKGNDLSKKGYSFKS